MKNSNGVTVRSLSQFLAACALVCGLVTIFSLSSLSSQAGATSAPTCSPQTTNTASGSTMRVGSVLTEGNSLTNGTITATLQTDGNFVIYSGSMPIFATWTLSATDPHEWLTQQADGNLVIYNGSCQPVWATMNFGSNATATLQASGNLVVSSNGTQLWASGSQACAPIDTAGGSTMRVGSVLTEGNSLTNGSIKASLQTDGNFVIYDRSSPLWATWTLSATDRHEWLTLQADGNLVIYNGSCQPVWATMHFGSNATATIQASYDPLQPVGGLYVSGTSNGSSGLLWQSGENVPLMGVYRFPRDSSNGYSNVFSNGWNLIGDTGALGTGGSPYTGLYLGDDQPTGVSAAQVGKPWLSFWTVSGPSPGDTTSFYNIGHQAGVFVANTINSYHLSILPTYVILDPEGYPDAHSGLEGGPASNWQQIMAGWADGLRSVNPNLRPGLYATQYEYTTFNLASLPLPIFLAVAFGSDGGNGIVPPSRLPGVNGGNIHGVIAWYAGPSNSVECNTVAQAEQSILSWGYRYNTLQFNPGLSCHA